MRVLELIVKEMLQKERKEINDKIDSKIKKLKEKIELNKLQDFQVIKYKNKEFRIYKWENKQFKDFSMPKGFDWCPYFDFVELVNKKKFEPEVWKSYIIKNQFKNNKTWTLAWACLGGGDWDSVDDNLDDSNGIGRVVVEKIGELKDE